MIYVFARSHRDATIHLREQHVDPRTVCVVTHHTGDAPLRGRELREGDQVWYCRTWWYGWSQMKTAASMQWAMMKAQHPDIELHQETLC